MKSTLTLTTALFTMMSIPAFAGDKAKDDITNMKKYDQNSQSAQYKDHKSNSESNRQDAMRHGDNQNWTADQKQNRTTENRSTDISNKSEEEGKLTFDDYDLDNNGEIDKNEILSVKHERDQRDQQVRGRFEGVEFEELDNNDDEVVSYEEWQNHFNASASIE